MTEAISTCAICGQAGHAASKHQQAEPVSKIEQHKTDRKTFREKLTANPELISESEFAGFVDESIALANESKDQWTGFFNNFASKVAALFSEGAWAGKETTSVDRLPLPSGKEVTQAQFFDDIRNAAREIGLDPDEFMRVRTLERAFWQYPSTEPEQIQALINSGIVPADEPGLAVCDPFVSDSEKVHDPRVPEFFDKYAADFNRICRELDIMLFKLYKKLHEKGYTKHDLSI
jgi:hypothetical protein